MQTIRFHGKYVSGFPGRSWLLLFPFSMLLFCWNCASAPALVVEMKGDDYHWNVRYPGPDGRLHTADDVVTARDLYLPAETAVTVKVTSEDYIYALKVPDLQLNQMGVPDVVFDLEFRSGQPARYPFEGDQMCGFSHDSLDGTVVVLPKADFANWLAQQPQPASQP